MEVSLQSFRNRYIYDPVKDLLGKGGFAEVFKAYDNEAKCFVALKIVQGSDEDKYNLSSEFTRFRNLSHPNIIKHIDFYEVTTGSANIHGTPLFYHVGILESADRGTLADLLKKGNADYRLLEDLAKDIIEGLAYLHANNIIHRDLKPTNILLFSEGEKLRAKITDFGIAKRTDATAASTQLVGTVEYMAPEYFTTGNITTASDVWSVGVMLLEALTGTHPFGKNTQGASNEQIIANILNKDISTATVNLTEPLKKIIIDCLRREVVLRTESAQVLKADLSNTTADTFTERTQVINHDRSKSTTKKNNTSLKVFMCEIKELLFDFRLSNGLWEKTLAKEVVVFFLTITLLIIYWKFRKVSIGSEGVFLSDYITHFLDLGGFEVREYDYINRNPVAYAFWFFVFRWIVSKLVTGFNHIGVSFGLKNIIKRTISNSRKIKVFFVRLVAATSVISFIGCVVFLAYQYKIESRILVPVFNSAGLVGYADSINNNIVIDYKFDNGERFNNGLAKVLLNKRFGFINKNGKLTIPAEYVDAKSFSDDVAAVAITGENGYKWGVINKTGEFIISPEFDMVNISKYGLIETTIYPEDHFVMGGSKLSGQKTQIFDTKGSEVINPLFDVCDIKIDKHSISVYSDWSDTGKIWVYKKNGELFYQGKKSKTFFRDYGDMMYIHNFLGHSYELLDTSYHSLLPRNYDDLTILNNNRFWVKDGETNYIIDRNGRIIKPIEYDVSKICNDNEALGFYEIMDSGRIGFINNDGEIKIRPTYDEAYCFNDTLLIVRKDDSWYKINGNCNVVYKYPNTVKDMFNEGWFSSRDTSGKLALLNENADIITDYLYDDIMFIFNTGIYQIKQGGKVGIINTKGKGKIIIEPTTEKFLHLIPIENFIVKGATSSVNIIDYNGNIVATLPHEIDRDNFYRREDGIIGVLTNEGEFKCYNLAGKLIELDRSRRSPFLNPFGYLTKW